MDLNDELCRTDFFDFACPKLEPGSNGLTPVAFIDSVDYVQTDGNNNLGASSGHIKSFLDEILLTDTLHSNQNGETLQNGHNTFELLGTFQWSNVGGGGENVSEGSPGLTADPSPSWLLNNGVANDGEVTTLTNLLDPLFVSYEDSKLDQYFITSNSSGDNSTVISSDLISTTFLNENSGSPTTSENDLIPWQKNSDVFCDESLLRSALQAGNKQQQITILSQKAVSASDMTELRKVLSFPPLTNGGSSNPNGSPSSTETTPTEGSTTIEISSETPYYELKVLDPMYNVDPDANIPNVEELIMTRIDPPFSGNGTAKKISEISEKKINSTTLSTKWTYATPSDQGKTPRRRNGKNTKNGLKQMNHNNNSNDGNSSNICILPNVGIFSPSGSPTNTNSNGSSATNGSSNGSSVSSNGNSRKERSLHYCNICCKGFKDKYSVNVHVRTHTGEKPFSCTLCGKNFRQKAHLAKHYQTHAAKGNNLHGKAAVKR